MHTPRAWLYLPLLVTLVAGCSAHADDLALTPEAADAYVDFAAFVASKVQGVELQLTDEEHRQAVEMLHKNWNGSTPEWKRLVLRSPELYVLLLRSWRAADANTREQLRAAWAKQLKLPKPAPAITAFKAKTLTATDQQALNDARRLTYQTTSNVMRAYHEMSMTAIHNINSDSRWHYEYRPKP